MGGMYETRHRLYTTVYPPPVREWVLGRNGQISLTGGGMLFWPVSSFLPTFLTIFSIFSSENVLKRFFELPPRPPTCRHPPPTPYTPPVGLPSQISLTGGQPKKGQISLTGGGILLGGYTVGAYYPVRESCMSIGGGKTSNFIHKEKALEVTLKEVFRCVYA